MCFEDVYDTENIDFYFDELITNENSELLREEHKEEYDDEPEFKEKQDDRVLDIF